MDGDKKLRGNRRSTDKKENFRIGLAIGITVGLICGILLKML